MWQRYLGFVTVLLGVLALIVAMVLNKQHHSIVERMTRQAEQSVLSQYNSMAAELVYVHSDLHYLAAMLELGSLVQTTDAETRRLLSLALAQRYASFSVYQGRYDQIRYIDREGMERVRVNLVDSAAEIVPQARLQSKRHRDYFTESIANAVGAVYVSPFDLNVEHNEVELPFKPMLRFAVPVADGQGGKAGVVIINYLGNILLQHLAKLNSLMPGKSAVLNRKGQYLIGFRPEQSWGFMFNGHDEEQLAQSAPGLWRAILNKREGQIETARGDVYTFAWLTLGEGGLAGCANCAVVITHRLTKEDFAAAHWVIVAPMLSITFIVLLLVVVSGVILFWSMQQRRQAAAQLMELNQRIERERDVFAAGPAVIFRWRNEFGWPVEYVSANLKPVFGYDPVQFLGEGLGLASIVEPSYFQALSMELEQGLAEGHRSFNRSPYRLVDRQGRHLWVSDTVRVVRDLQGRVIELYAYVTDISRLKAAEQELERSRTFVQKVVDTIADPTIVIDARNYQIVSANQAARESYLPDGRMMAGLTCHQLSHKRDKPCSLPDEPCPLRTILSTKAPYSVIHKHFDSKGLAFYVEINATPIMDERGQVIQIVESHRDITRHVEKSEILQQLATTDRLTGVFNRAKFEEVLDQQITGAAKGGRQLGLIMFDIDHFKQVNDTYGHDMGDRVLKEIVARIGSTIRDYDMLARWGGEEFYILLTRADRHGAEVAAETVRLAIEQTPFDGAGRITISLGVTVWCPGDDRESITKRTDQALYEAKQAGRNRVVFKASGSG
jgi:diguanylate cyclase (GGDEF)-like protein/PAS domain S-box-containing protein